MSFFDVIGNVGGIASTFMSLFGIIISYYAEISFMIVAINDMYVIKSEDASLSFKQGDQQKLKVGFVDKLKLITNCRPNQKMKRMLEKGYKRLAFELDLMDIIK